MSDRRKQIVSANDLLVGDVVYLTENGSWSRDLIDAAVAENDEIANALLEIANRQPERVVGPYLVDVKQDNNSIVPNHIREQLRGLGPSVLSANTGTAN